MHARVALAAVALSACSYLRPTDRIAADDGRPGLGTHWGETRSSFVRGVPFDRASEAPFAQATIFYDDRAGVSAMAGREELAFVGLPMHRKLATAIVDDRGRELETFRAAGRIYVIGREGDRYRLRVHNGTSQRVEVVASVDGLDVMDGAAASYQKRGYVVGPFGTLIIDGFRRSLREVAAFRFGAVADSYASRKGDDRNVGVIGVAFFDERRARFQEDDLDGEAERRRKAEPFSDARFAQPPG